MVSKRLSKAAHNKIIIMIKVLVPNYHEESTLRHLGH